jgi:hypothetical protein
MKPYDEKFIIDKIEEYNAQIKVHEIGQYKALKREGFKGIIDGYLYEKEGEVNTKIPELICNDKICMRISPKEIQGSYEFIKMAKGRVGIAGLGLGYIVQEISKKDEVYEIVVYEISQDVIDIYNSNFKNNEKIKIIYGDAFKAKGEKFDFFFSDIYEYKLSLNVVEDYIKFNNIHQIEEYLFFGVEHFLLSCSYEEIVWVYIPENWMEMSKRLASTLDDSGNMRYYKKLDEKLVSEVLEAFKPVFNNDEE